MENSSIRSQLKENARSTVETAGSAISDSVTRGTDAIGAAAKDAMNSASGDLKSLQADINGLKDTVTRFMSQTADQAAKSAKDVTATVAGRVSDVAGDLADRGSAMASSAQQQAKTFASELEGMARRNPIGALAGAVLLGVLIGALGRRS
jgi:ElaB/YqjD/DUF883 family membrane-anchored ribosome-binding protein